LPDNDLTIATVVNTCTPSSPAPPPFLAPSFDNFGVHLLVQNSLQAPSVMVLGLNAQPALIAMNGILPCIVLPSPDAVLFIPSGEYNLPLPASVRPATFYAQGVSLTPQGLRVTDGYAVTAN